MLFEVYKRFEFRVFQTKFLTLWRQHLVLAEPKAVRFADLGGIDSILKDILELVQWPLLHPEVSGLKSL